MNRKSTFIVRKSTFIVRKIGLLISLAFILLSAAFPMQGEIVLTGQKLKKEIGVQLYSVRDLIGSGPEMAAKLPAVLDSLAAMGYTHVEAANYGDGRFYGIPAKEFGELCRSHGVRPSSSHTTRPLSPEEIESGDFTQALKWWEEAIQAHKDAGMEYIVSPYLHVSSLKELDAYCRYYDKVGEMAAKAGLKYGYHNHAHEFEKVDGETVLDYMLTHTNPENVFFQLDVYWSMMGHASAVEYFRKYPGRFKLLHIKDKHEVGQSGMVGFDAILSNRGLAGVEDIIVEAEGSSYGDILRTMRESIAYLRHLRLPLPPTNPDFPD